MTCYGSDLSLFQRDGNIFFKQARPKYPSNIKGLSCCAVTQDGLMRSSTVCVLFTLSLCRFDTLQTLKDRTRYRITWSNLLRFNSSSKWRPGQRHWHCLTSQPCSCSFLCNSPSGVIESLVYCAVSWPRSPDTTRSAKCLLSVGSSFRNRCLLLMYDWLFYAWRFNKRCFPRK